MDRRDDNMLDCERGRRTLSQNYGTRFGPPLVIISNFYDVMGIRGGVHAYPIDVDLLCLMSASARRSEMGIQTTIC